MKLLFLGLFISAQSFTPMIVGGGPAAKNEAPFMVSLQHNSYGHMCGGTLIKSNVVVTAAHCAPYIQSVLVGTNNLNGGGIKIKVKKVIVHQEYDPNLMSNDIALVILERDVRNKTISLYDKEPSNEQSIVYGWGALTENGSSPKLLQKVQVPIVDRIKCNAKESYDGEIDQTMICAGIPEGGKDSCQGDSGGPLVINGKLAGIVSWGYGCARPNKYGVYANVFYLTDWIKNEASK